ncbi:uncharacterized protein LOC135212004 [Macrobrachium nipponense]|uniref:uncharacterized protein LOC135212004 n=1 Tax=Macrobrachium nipponense TaxID=159736 RepID=UPI0030C8A716
MTLRLNLEGYKHATVISAYPPTFLAEDQTKELFYAALDTVLTAIPNEDKVILLGDFNARVRGDSDIWRGSIGKEGVGKINANGTLLLSKCVEHDLRCLANKLEQEYPPNNVDHWRKFKDSVISACKESVGLKKCKHQDWFDQNDAAIQDLIQKARKYLFEHLNDPKSDTKKKIHHTAKAQMQNATREMKNKWLTDKANELQSFFDRNDMRSLFSGMKAIFGPNSQGLAPLHSQDGTRLLKNNNEILSRWKEHFKELLNRDPMIDEDVVQQLPRLPLDMTLAVVPTLEEVELAIFSMNNKAAGPNNIPAELYKYGGPTLHSQLHQLIEKIWMHEEIPNDLIDGIINTMYKKKGYRSVCGNDRGITLLSVAGKVLARILTIRLTLLAEKILPKSQCGFRPAHGTADMVFSSRQLQERCREQQKPLYMGFTDLTKAFDSVNHELLWEILSRYGRPPKFIKILRLLHDNMSVTVMANGISINYRTDGGIFNLNRLKARTEVNVTAIVGLQYADNNAVCAQTENDLTLLPRVAERAEEFLKVSSAPILSFSDGWSSVTERGVVITRTGGLISAHAKPNTPNVYIISLSGPEFPLTHL